MKKDQLVLTILTIFLVSTLLVGIASAAIQQHNVIIGYHQKPDNLDKNKIVNYGGKIKHNFSIISAISANISDQAVANLTKDPRVAYVENDSIFRAADEYTSSWGVQYIGSRPVHNQSINGAGIKIAVLDTGIDYNHEDLKNSYKGGFDFVNNDSDPWDDNCISFFKTCHGTHVSGIIVAEHNNIGIVGVAPGASLYAVKVLDGGGFGTASLVVSGIEWAKNNGMKIISMSLESNENNTAVLDAVNVAYNSGILLVAAGGNTGGGTVLYPAAYDSVIAVAAVDQNGQRASFSPIDQKIEVAAPGVGINSTACVIADLYHCIQDGYGLLSGTSMAAPYVTGVAALIFSTNFPDINGDGSRNNKDVREIIRNMAFDAGSQGNDNVYGYGILDAQNAVLGISTFITPTPTDTVLNLNKTNMSPDKDAKNVSLSNGSYTVKITNYGLYKINVDIYKAGSDVYKTSSKNVKKHYIRKLTFVFNNRRQDAHFDIDAQNVAFIVNFTPYGRPNTSAIVNITEKRRK